MSGGQTASFPRLQCPPQVPVLGLGVLGIHRHRTPCPVPLLPLPWLGRNFEMPLLDCALCHTAVLRLPLWSLMAFLFCPELLAGFLLPAGPQWERSGSLNPGLTGPGQEPGRPLTGASWAISRNALLPGCLSTYYPQTAPPLEAPPRGNNPPWTNCCWCGR